MRFLTDRQAIAKAINIDDVPVVTIDVTKGIDDILCNSYRGSKIKVWKDGFEYPLRCEVAMWGDQSGNECHDTPWFYKKIVLGNTPTFISSDFSARDIREMTEWNNCRSVRAGDRIIVVFDNGNKGVMVREMKVGQHIDMHCTTVVRLEDVTEKMEII